MKPCLSYFSIRPSFLSTQPLLAQALNISFLKFNMINVFELTSQHPPFRIHTSRQIFLKHYSSLFLSYSIHRHPLGPFINDADVLQSCFPQAPPIPPPPVCSSLFSCTQGPTPGTFSPAVHPKEGLSLSPFFTALLPCSPGQHRPCLLSSLHTGSLGKCSILSMESANPLRVLKTLGTAHRSTQCLR